MRVARRFDVLGGAHVRRREREAQAEALARQRAIEAAERAAEKTRRDGLLTKTNDWQQARMIRDYVAGVSAAPIDGQPAQHERVRWCA